MSPPQSTFTLAVVCNTLPPYRIAAQKRFASEIPGCRLLTINTHADLSRDWSIDTPPEIGLQDVSRGDRGRAGWWKEHARGGEVTKILQRENVGFVLCTGYSDACRRRIIRWCRANGVPCFMFTDGNIESDRSAQRGLKGIVKRLLVGHFVKLCAGFFSCGTLGKKYWEYYGAPSDSIFFLPHEPDYAQLDQLSDEAIEATAQQYGLAPGRRRLVYCGRFIRVKRVDLLVKAFVQIAPERPDWDLVLVGDGELCEELQALVPKDLEERVLWTGFLADQADVSKVYRASDALVLPSDYEPWAAVIVEAVAAGMAVVATNVVGAAADLIKDGVNGRVVPPSDGEALREALLDVTEAKQIDAMRAAAPRVFSEWKSWGDQVKGMTDALRKAKVI